MSHLHLSADDRRAAAVSTQVPSIADTEAANTAPTEAITHVRRRISTTDREPGSKVPKPDDRSLTYPAARR
jgi:hypothetical protein